MRGRIDFAAGVSSCVPLRARYHKWPSMAPSYKTWWDPAAAAGPFAHLGKHYGSVPVDRPFQCDVVALLKIG